MRNCHTQLSLQPEGSVSTPGIAWFFTFCNCMRKLRDDDQKRKVMKKNPRSWLSMALSAIMLALLWGCATPQQTETLLTKAGFKSVPTSTPPQEEHLRTLSA